MAASDNSNAGITERQLESFLQVALSPTVRRSDRRVPYHVKALQDQLNVALWDPRSGQLTQAGEELRPEIERLRRKIQRLRDDAAAYRGIRVRCFPVHVPMVLADSAAEFHADHPETELHFEEALSGRLDEVERNLIGPLLGNKVHFSIGGPERPPIPWVPLYQTPLVAVSYRRSETTRWAHRQDIELRELRDLPLLAPDAGSFSRRLLESAATSVRQQLTFVRVRTTSAGALMACAVRQMGVAVMTEDLARSWVSTPWHDGSAVRVLIRRSPAGALVIQNVGVHYRPDFSYSDIELAFLSTMTRVAHDRHHSRDNPWQACAICRATR